MQSVCRPGLVNGLPVFSLWKVRKFSEIKCNLTQCNSVLGATKARDSPLSRSAGLTSTLLYRPACSCLLMANAYASPCTWLLHPGSACKHSWLGCSGSHSQILRRGSWWAQCSVGSPPSAIKLGQRGVVSRGTNMVAGLPFQQGGIMIGMSGTHYTHM